MQFFEELASIECPPAIQTRYFKVLGGVLKEKVQQVPDKTELVVILEGLSDPHVQITEVLIDAVVASFEKVTGDYEKIKSLYCSTDRYRSAVGSILKNLLDKRFQCCHDTVSVSSLLSWDAWPVCLSIYNSELAMSGESKSCLPEECKAYCKEAYEILKDLLGKIFKASVCVGDIEEIKKNRPLFVKLCEATKENLHDVENMLDYRCKEYTLFKRCQRNLKSFCKDLDAAKKVVVEGLSQLLKELHDDFSSTPISLLVQRGTPP
jgi:hypothetical protein